MSQPTAAGRTGESWTAEASAAASTGTGMVNRNALVTSDGKISMAESVVQVAGKACLEVDGVHAMSTGGASPSTTFTCPPRTPLTRSHILEDLAVRE